MSFFVPVVCRVNHKSSLKKNFVGFSPQGLQSIRVWSFDGFFCQLTIYFVYLANKWGQYSLYMFHHLKHKHIFIYLQIHFHQHIHPLHQTGHHDHRPPSSESCLQPPYSPPPYCSNTHQTPPPYCHFDSNPSSL